MGVSIKDIDGLKGLITEEWSDWTDQIEITQDMVNTFADVTHDHQWIHVDIEKANAGPFGGPIAHGFLTLSLVSYFGSQGGPKIEGSVHVVGDEKPAVLYESLGLLLG